MPERPPIDLVPGAKVVDPKRTRPSLVWIVPLLAAAVGAWVAIAQIRARGPEITIVFSTAEGLEAGKTAIHYNGVAVGTVDTVKLSADHESVVITARMAADTSSLLVEDTAFWVVRPRISGANVSGIGTLISGAYVGMEIGTSKKSRRDFVGLEEPPVVTIDAPGRYFVVTAPDLGSLETGTPIYFRRLQVGQVTSYELDKDGKALSVRLFVRAPYDQYVNPSTRFWQASGIDVSLSASGLTVQTQSLLSILVGGIAFETPPTGPVLPPADPDTRFTLFNSRTEAFQLPARDPQVYQLVFKQSVRGLAPGAPVEFRGIPIGEVTQIDAQVDTQTMEFTAPVTVHLDAERMGVKLLDMAPGENRDVMRRKVMEAFVTHGVRAQLQTGNMLTGSLFVAFDFFPDAAPATIDWGTTPVVLPTVPGELQALEASVVGIIKKLDQIPFQTIAKDLQKTIVELDRTLASARRTVDDAGKLVEPNSVLGAELGSTLQEVSRAARGLRVLADYLERHPEALIRGKPGEAK